MSDNANTYADNSYTVREYANGAVQIVIEMMVDKDTSDKIFDFLKSLPKQTQGEAISGYVENLGPQFVPRQPATQSKRAPPTATVKRVNHNCVYCKPYTREEMKAMCKQYDI